MHVNAFQNRIYVGKSTTSNTSNNNRSNKQVGLNDTLVLRSLNDSVVSITSTSKYRFDSVSLDVKKTLSYYSLRDIDPSNPFHVHGQYAWEETLSGKITLDSIEITYTKYLSLDLGIRNWQQYIFKGKLLIN